MRPSPRGGLLQRLDQGFQPARLGLAIGQARPVLDAEDVQDHPVLGRHARVGDVGAQGGHGLGQVGEQAGPIGGGDGDFCGLDGQPLDRRDRRRLGRRPGSAGAFDQGRMGRQRILARHVLAPEQGGDLIVEGAHQLTLPAVPHPRPHRPDVGDGQDQQHPQPLGVADQFGEGADGGGVAEVALLGVVAERQMAAHQPDHQFDPAGIDAEPLAGSPGRRWRRPPAARARRPCPHRAAASPASGLPCPRSDARSRWPSDGRSSACRARCR